MIQTQTRLNPICRTSGEHCHAFPQLLLGLRGTTDCEFEHTGCGISAEQVAVVPRDAAHFFAGKNADSQLLVVDLDVAALIDDGPGPHSTDAPNDELFAEPRFMYMSDDLRQLTRCAARQLSSLPRHTDILAYQWATLLTAQTRLLFTTNTTMPQDQRIDLDRLIDSRLNSPPSNHELQRTLGMSSTRLNGWARERFGMTPQQRVLERRLQWAQHWLRTTDKPISHIAHDLGFCNSSALTHVCRRVLEATPGELRRQRR
ncbi:AraC family transcriptional regulator [Salinisphaera orenii]|uniref:AraC family transcriptional regulator n=1 Tax=Salinisphaera orenii TaxID=856731 RepID=UPI000DBE2774